MKKRRQHQKIDDEKQKTLRGQDPDRNRRSPLQSHCSRRKEAMMRKRRKKTRRKVRCVRNHQNRIDPLRPPRRPHLHLITTTFQTIPMIILDPKSCQKSSRNKYYTTISASFISIFSFLNSLFIVNIYNMNNYIIVF